MLRGIEYFPVPAATNASSVVVVSSRGRPSTVRKPNPQFQAPYLQALRVSREIVIYKPPPFVAARFQPGRLPPVISVQTELNATNFHELIKSAIVDPEIQLTPPAWELRTPSPEELVAEKEFEAEEAIWDDEYWREVARYRQRLEITPKVERAAYPRRAAPSTSASQERSFQRGDSFRVEPKVPTSPTGPTQAFTKARTRKPPLPAAATRATTKRLPADKRSGSLASVETSTTEAHDPPTAPSTPVNTRDTLHDFRSPSAPSHAAVRAETPPPRKHDVRHPEEHEVHFTPPQLHRGRPEAHKGVTSPPPSRGPLHEPQDQKPPLSSSAPVQTVIKQGPAQTTPAKPAGAALKFRLPGRHGQLSWSVVLPHVQLEANNAITEADDIHSGASPRSKQSNGSFGAVLIEGAASGPTVDIHGDAKHDVRTESEERRRSAEVRSGARCCAAM